MSKVKTVEKKLRAAFEQALEAGYYPQDGTFGNDRGGCCALGMLGVVSFVPETPDDRYGSKQYSSGNYAALLGLTPAQLRNIVFGFDGYKYDGGSVDYVRDYFELGRRLREDYFLCDGQDPHFT